MLHTPADLAPGAGGQRRPPRMPAVRADRADSGLGLGELLLVLRRRRAILIVCTVLVPLLAALALSRITPRFTADGALIYEPSAYAVQEMQSILRVDPTTDAIMASQAEIVRSLRVAERIAEQLRLGDRPEFNAALHPPSAAARVAALLRRLVGAGAAPDPNEAEQRQGVALAVQQALEVRALHASRVLEVAFTSQDKALAAAAANLAMDLYIADQLDAKFVAVRRANGWLQQRVSELRAEVGAAEDRIAAYRARAGLLQGVAAGLDTEQISRLTADLQQARNEAAQAEARLDATRGRAGAAAQAAITPSVTPLRTRQEELAGQLQSLLSRLGPNHPDAVSLRSQVAEAQRATGSEVARVVAAAEAELRADRARVAALEASLRDSQGKVERNTQAEIPLGAMQREADAARTLLQAVLERMQQTAQQSAIEQPDARVISPAVPPLQPSYPKTALLLAAAAASGVFLGLLLVYLREITDGTLRSGDDVRALFGLPCLALVPELPRRALGRDRVEDYVAQRPFSPFAEQLRALRAGLWLGAERPKAIAVTAARPGEGKTTVAIALARAAAMAGERVAVLDCDMREPMLGRLLGVDFGAGLIDVLQGSTGIDDILRTDPLTGMTFLPAGEADANSLGLFMSPAMGALLEALRARFDLVLLDAPPAFAMADARVIARLADTTLVCVRWRDTPRLVVRHSLDLLDDAEAHVGGLVLTRVDARAHVRSGYADAEVYHPRYGGYFRE